MYKKIGSAQFLWNMTRVKCAIFSRFQINEIHKLNEILISIEALTTFPFHVSPSLGWPSSLE